MAGSKVNCNYRTCVECLRDSDCGGGPNYCSSGPGYGNCGNRIKDAERAEERRKEQQQIAGALAAQEQQAKQRARIQTALSLG